MMEITSKLLLIGLSAIKTQRASISQSSILILVSSSSPELAILFVMGEVEADLGGEIGKNSSKADFAAIEISMVPNNQTEDQQQTQRKRLEKAAKIVFVLFLSLSVSIIVAVLANAYKSGRSRGKLIIYKASAGFALISFFAGVIGLLISSQFEMVKRSTQFGLILATAITGIASVVVLTINTFI